MQRSTKLSAFFSLIFFLSSFSPARASTCDDYTRLVKSVTQLENQISDYNQATEYFRHESGNRNAGITVTAIGVVALALIIAYGAKQLPENLAIAHTDLKSVLTLIKNGEEMPNYVVNWAKQDLMLIAGGSIAEIATASGLTYFISSKHYRTIDAELKKRTAIIAQMNELKQREWNLALQIDKELNCSSSK